MLQRFKRICGGFRRIQFLLPGLRGKVMEIAGKQINDECTKCAELLQCELFKQGHGIRQPRSNIRQMLECQMKHREKAGGVE
nr:MAG TPA: hypothetical protein [Bacteriophage sp.]